MRHCSGEKSLAVGKQPYISLNYVDFRGVSTAQTNPAEYAEFLLAVFQHMQTRNGFVPEGVEASLEPDTTNHWTPVALGRAIVAAKARLNAAGFSPEFIAPSVANMRSGASFIDGMLAVPGAAAAIAEFSYHRYGGGDPELNGIVQRAIQHGKRTSMLEYWGDFKTANSGAGYRTLAQDLTRGRNSALQQCVFADNYGCISQIIRPVNLVPELVSEYPTDPAVHEIHRPRRSADRRDLGLGGVPRIGGVREARRPVRGRREGRWRIGECFRRRTSRRDVHAVIRNALDLEYLAARRDHCRRAELDDIDSG